MAGPEGSTEERTRELVAACAEEVFTADPTSREDPLVSGSFWDAMGDVLQASEYAAAVRFLVELLRRHDGALRERKAAACALRFVLDVWDGADPEARLAEQELWRIYTDKRSAPALRLAAMPGGPAPTDGVLGAVADIARDGTEPLPVRKQAIWGLARSPLGVAVDLSLMKDRAQPLEIRRAALWAVRTVDARDVLTELVGLVERRDELFADVMAVFSFAALARKTADARRADAGVEHLYQTALRVLSELLVNPTEALAMRIAAMKTLGDVVDDGGRILREAWRLLTSDREPDLLRQAAARALRQQPTVVDVAELQRLAGDARLSFGLRAEVIDTLVDCGLGRVPFPEYVVTLGEPPPAEAARLRARRDDVIAFFSRAMADEREALSCREKFAWALGKLPVGETVPQFTRLLLDADAPDSLRGIAALSLSREGACAKLAAGDAPALLAQCDVLIARHPARSYPSRQALALRDALAKRFGR